MQFFKYQGLGNDFVLIDSRKEKLSDIDLKKLALDMCDRHFGVGADGLLIVWPSQNAHYRMQIFNPDGSEAEMCGNGIRCFAKYVYETDKLKEELISVETLSGIKLPAVILGPEKTVAGVEVDMGIPEKIKNGSTSSPYQPSREKSRDKKIKIKNNEYDINEISMGNPHAVIFTDDLAKINLGEIGSLIENDPHFPNRTNVEFVKVISDKEIEVLVWERGAGETLACGTGACACVAAANLLGKTGKRVMVNLPGGKLDVEWAEDQHILLRGPVEKVFEGTYQL